MRQLSSAFRCADISPRPVSVAHPGRRHRRASLHPLHDARHGCATLLTAAGTAPRVVMEILGHSQIAVATNIPAHVGQDTRRETVSLLDRMPGRHRPDRG
ncbi:putative phage integrase [Streptomyces griseus subsp. griseus NBRC 13350]|uniref:Phage integrase n=1 Tax=Streptomyces griseus subsp. griseus (strain JCM 4626 / CBS 651.72 / NBRC 13350 / KCC S-0626 / ISP 5235) TaxID=455632 RepID=B1VYI9_STRGG|nr:putative phage integrase [Streptomyces griseus subsp. griseus NBRC 13350]SQA26018.1 phage integrase [Streptomyces griseus]